MGARAGAWGRVGVHGVGCVRDGRGPTCVFFTTTDERRVTSQANGSRVRKAPNVPMLTIATPTSELTGT